MTREDIRPFVAPLLTNMFAAMNLPCSIENDYVMKGAE